MTEAMRLLLSILCLFCIGATLSPKDAANRSGKPMVIVPPPAPGVTLPSFKKPSNWDTNKVSYLQQTTDLVTWVPVCMTAPGPWSGTMTVSDGGQQTFYRLS